MSERIRSKLAQNAEAGKAHGGPWPFGFQRVEGRLVLDPGRGRRHRRDGGAGVGWRVVTGALRGAEPPRRAPGSGTFLARPDVALRPTTLRIAGLVPRVRPARGRRRRGGDHRPPDMGAIARQTRPAAPRSSAASYLLTGFLICGTCQRRLYSKSGSQRRIYTCRREEDPAACGSNSVEAGPVEGVADRAAVLDAAAGTNVAGVRTERTASETVVPRRRGRRRRGATRPAGRRARRTAAQSGRVGGSPSDHRGATAGEPRGTRCARRAAGPPRSSSASTSTASRRSRSTPSGHSSGSTSSAYRHRQGDRQTWRPLRPGPSPHRLACVTPTPAPTAWICLCGYSSLGTRLNAEVNLVSRAVSSPKLTVSTAAPPSSFAALEPPDLFVDEVTQDFALLHRAAITYVRSHGEPPARWV